MSNLVVINSLSHSGSTILSMIIANHEEMISLGEIYQVLREPSSYWLNDSEKKCSCGLAAAECEFWGDTLRKTNHLEKTETDQHKLIAAKYKIAIDAFHHQYENKTPVDTSKGERHLKLLIKLAWPTIKLIYLIRDVRGYALSQTTLARSQNRKGMKRIKNSMAFQFLKWYFTNRNRLKIITQSNLDHVITSYEALCLNTAPSTNAISDFLSVNNTQTPGLDSSQHHVLFGNPIRNTPDKRKSLQYDARWENNMECKKTAKKLAFVMRYNERMVYFYEH